MSKNALEVEHLSVYYHTHPVLWDVTCTVPEKQLVGIVGPNGAGKSTFVKALLNLVSPSSGKILFFGEQYKQAKKNIAYIPQKNSVDWQFPITAFDVVLMGCYQSLGWFKKPRKEDKERAFHYLEKLEMGSFAKRQIGELSGGQQQRLFIARALMQEASVLFLDEPFVGIDHTTECFLLDLFKSLVKNGKTIFVVHHDLSRIKEYFDWTILLNTRLVKSGKTQEVFTMENLCETYGNKEEILEKALMLSNIKLQGYE